MITSIPEELHQPDPARGKLPGFCKCGRILTPDTLWSCAPCRAEEKTKKRRYKRATAEGQLVEVIKRCEEVAANPRRFFYMPQVLVLFGSMLKTDGSDVGDIDLWLDGSDLWRESNELRKEASEWADANAPDNWRYRRHENRHLDYASQAAKKYIRGGSMARIGLDSFTHVAGGMPVPYQIAWHNKNLDIDFYRRSIDEERAKVWADFCEGTAKSQAETLAKLGMR